MKTIKSLYQCFRLFSFVSALLATLSFSASAYGQHCSNLILAPANMADLPNGTYYFLVTGSTSGSGWGIGPYRDDSALAAMAVHAGAVSSGSRKVIEVIKAASAGSYTGSTANAVTTSSGSAGAHGGYTVTAETCTLTADTLYSQMFYGASLDDDTRNGNKTVATGSLLAMLGKPAAGTTAYVRTFRKDAGYYVLDSGAFSVADGVKADIAVSRDWLAVSAPDNDTAATDAGKVMVYKLVTGSFSLSHTLTHPEASASRKFFGTSVDISGDILAVSDQTSSTSARVYLYQYDSTGNAWLPQQLDTQGVTFSTATVSLSGNTLAVADWKYTDNPGAPEKGKVYLFQRYSSQNWTLAQEITLDTPASGDKFGASVSLNVNQLLIGAPGREVSSVSHAGAAYLYVKPVGDNAEWEQTYAFEPSYLATDLAFGTAVAVSGARAAVSTADTESYAFTKTSDTTWGEEIFSTGDQVTSVDVVGNNVFRGIPTSTLQQYDETGLAFADYLPVPASPFFDDADRDGVNDTYYSSSGTTLDMDGDGMPNDWEIRHGLDPLDPDDAVLDYDSDGVTNLDEFTATTDPNNPLSCTGGSCVFDAAPAPATISFPSVDTISDQVGATAGSFNVSNTGAAQYTIPLYVPPGTAGVTPKLALQYRSDGSNGTVGLGWSVGPLSAISRCPLTFAQDGQARQIMMDVDDRFCLDGQRLVLVDPQDTYGGDEVEYRTAFDSTTKIVSYGLGPASFKVWHKDGSVSEYGGTADSSLSGLTWAQNSLEDATSANSSHNNRIVYTYNTPGYGEALRVEKIEYAYGGGSFNSQIEFAYEDKPEPAVDKYVAGTPYLDHKRLTTITAQTKVSSSFVDLREYTLAYVDVSASVNKTSKLASITECRDAVCLPPTAFTWSDTGIDFGFTESTSIEAAGIEPFYTYPGFRKFAPADFNGDGYADLVWLGGEGTAFNVSLSDGTTLATSITSSGAHSIKGWTVFDYDQDGFPDILFTEDSYLYLYKNVLVGEERALAAEPVLLIDYLSGYSLLYPQGVFADVNGDGLIDIRDGDVVYYMIPDGEAVNGPYKFSSAIGLDLGAARADALYAIGLVVPGHGGGIYDFDLDYVDFSGDFNGDGLRDMVVNLRSNQANVVCYAEKVILKNNGNGTFDYYSFFNEGYHDCGHWYYPHDPWPYDAQYIPPVPPKAWITDLNNDGKADAAFQDAGNHLSWGLNPGVQTAPLFESTLQQMYSPDPRTSDLMLVDINQDSLPDLVYRHYDEGDQLAVQYNLGSEFDSTVYNLAPLTPPPSSRSEEFAQDLLYNGNHVFLDINGDSILDFVDLESSAWLGNKASGTVWNRITQITNGLGQETSITYGQLTDPALHIREFDGPTIESCYTVETIVSCYPVIDVFAPITVVSEVSTSSPILGDAAYEKSVSYQYQGLKAQPGGEGALGFHQIRTADDETGTVTSRTFAQVFPFTGLLAETQTYLSGEATPLTETVNTYDELNGTPPFLVTLTESVTTQRVAESTSTTSPLLTISDVLTTRTSTLDDFDEYGNPGTMIVVTTGDGNTHTTTTTNTYANDTGDWILGKLTQAEVEQVVGGSTITRTTDFTYDSYGRLLTQVREPSGDTKVKLTTSYEYDAYGNPLKVTQSGAAGTRYMRTVYDTTGRFVDKTYNSLEQLVSEVTLRDAYGNPETVKGLNGAEQYTRYGTFGREFFSAKKSGLAGTKQYRLCSAVSCPSGAAFRLQISGTDGTLTNSYADVLGRTIRTEMQTFDSTLSLTDTQYDGAGRVKKVSMPYFIGDTVYWTTNTYDNLGRVIKVVDARDGESTNQFSLYDDSGTLGIQQLSTNQLSQTKTIVSNGRGQTIKVIDDLTGYIDYTYDAAGNMVEQDANGVVSTIGFDILGRKISLDDPDQGEWDYVYNAFGEMTSQEDELGAITSTTYDTLGRMATRQDRKPNTTLESETLWFYGTDASKHNVGQLALEIDSLSGYIKAYAYDGLGRLNRTVTSLGEDGSEGDYAEYTTYDEFGRMFQQIDATAKGVQHVYNAYGFEEKLIEASNTTHVYREVTETNARNQTTGQAIADAQFEVARGYDPRTGFASTILATSSYTSPHTLLDVTLDFDEVGNLASRVREVQAEGLLSAKTLSETFTYDELNRLTDITIAGGATQMLGYALNGNITSKTGVGSYTYDPSRPHAVETAGIATYTYDAVGNMLSGGGRTAVYNTFRKPISITLDSHTTTFAYAPNRSHYLRIDNTGINITKTLTVGNVEFITVDAGLVKTKRYIGGVMVVTDFNSTHEEHVLLTDHIGSTVVVAKVNSLDMNQVDFDAFGKRRDLWTEEELLAAASITLNRLTTQGFTGHEMVDEVGLIHMKGRVYDPNLGRFLSADPFITELDNTQNMNRYSYVYNNPLTLTDPNGFMVCPKWMEDYLRPLCELFGWGAATTCDWDYYPEVGCSSPRLTDPQSTDPQPTDPYNDPNYVKATNNNAGAGNGSPGAGGGGGGNGNPGGTTRKSEADQYRDFLNRLLFDSKRHFYKTSVPTLCTPEETFAAMRMPGMSAPGAYFAYEGTIPNIYLYGFTGRTNPITQTVDSTTMTITNKAQEGHSFFPGTVTIQVTPGPNGTSIITITGVGEGDNALWNEFLGYAFFAGYSAATIQNGCDAAAGLYRP